MTSATIDKMIAMTSFDVTVARGFAYDVDAEALHIMSTDGTIAAVDPSCQSKKPEVSSKQFDSAHCISTEPGGTLPGESRDSDGGLSQIDRRLAQ